MEENKLNLNEITYPIVYSTDENYIPYLGVSIQSILCNINTEDNFSIYIFHDRVTKNSQEKITRMQTDNVSIKFLDISEYLNFDHNLLKTTYHFTKEMYYRILIPKIFSEYKKVLYIDCDLVFNINPKKYFELNLEEKYFGAVNDIGVLNLKSKHNKYVKSLNVQPEKYFNSGVLIMNIPALKSINLYEKFINILQTETNFRFPDQDILNIICKDNVCYLDYNYNFQWGTYISNTPSENFLDQDLYKNYLNAANTPYIMHFATGNKPWNKPELLFSNYFWKYARLSPFYEEIIYNTIRLKTEGTHKILNILGLKIKLRKRKK